MNTEIEVKFLSVDLGTVREKLKELGGECEQPMRLMRRYTLENPYLKDGKDAFIRVRDEGDKTTLTYKQFDSLSLHGAKEIEVEVSDFDATAEILRQAGVGQNRCGFQESKRETWKLNGTEVVLDEWPWLKPYIEVEGSTEEAVRGVSAALGFDWNDAVFGDVMAAYRAEYRYLSETDTIGSLAEVRFGDSLPDLLREK